MDIKEMKKVALYHLDRRLDDYNRVSDISLRSQYYDMYHAVLMAYTSIELLSDEEIKRYDIKFKCVEF